jgi:hypothetical protein
MINNFFNHGLVNFTVQVSLHYFGRPSALTIYSTAETSSSENIITEVKQLTPAMRESGSSSRKVRLPNSTLHISLASFVQ